MACAKSASFVALMAGLLPCSAKAETGTGPTTLVHCHPHVDVRAADPKDIEDACRGVGLALSFFASHKIHLHSRVVLEISANLPKEASPTAAGIFLPRQRRIHVLSFVEFRKFKTWFRLPISRSLYRSLVTHEMAHAIASDNFKIPQPPILAWEYPAYVALFVTMSPTLRSLIMLAYRDDGFEDVTRVSPITYLVDPMRFGVKAYRHYTHLDDPTGFLQSVLDGKIWYDNIDLYGRSYPVSPWSPSIR